MYRKRGLWTIKAKNGGNFPKHDKKLANAAPAEKQTKFYPADDVKKPLVNRQKPNPLSPVLIILASRFKGKRVAFMKQLTSWLLLITGTFKINGVPLRQVNQSYLIATSTKVDLSGLNVNKLDDKYFAKHVGKKKKNNKGERDFFEAEKEEKNVLPTEKKDDQEIVDACLLKSIEALPDLKTNLAARFSLKAGMKPHEFDKTF
ncbi:hypothetical protein LguiA_002042 [Lonicera macranthoides]